MSASITDKVTDTRNAARPNSARATGTRSTGGVSLACDNLAGWPTASKVHFVTYQLDSSSEPVAGTQLDCSGIVSGNTIGSFTVIDGTDGGNVVGDVVEMLPTASWGQDLSDALLVGHTRTGAHASGLALTSPVLTTPVVTDFTSATHTQASAAQGGLLNGANAITDGTITPAELAAGAGASWAWQTWNSPLSSGLTVGNGTVNYALYTQTGKNVRCRYGLTFGTTTNKSGLVVFSLPVTSSSNYVASTSPLLSTAIILDSGSFFYSAFILWASTTTASLQYYKGDQTVVYTAATDDTLPMAEAANDGIYIEFEYEAA